MVEQTGGKWTPARRWKMPDRIEVRTKLCRVTFDFTDAVIASRTVRIDMDMQHGKLVIVGAPGIVIDADGLDLIFSKTEFHSDSAAADPGLPHRARGNAQAPRRSSSGGPEPVPVENPVLARLHFTGRGE